MPKIWMLAFFALFFLPFITLHADEIELHADEWCPYNCEANSEHEGYLIDLARAIFTQHGHTVTYVTTPWARALKMTQKKEHVGAPGAYIGNGEGLIFHRNTAGHSVNSFVVLKSSNWRYTGRDSLEGHTIAVIKDYTYGEPVDTYLKENKKDVIWLHGDSPLKSALQLLVRRRVTAVLDDKNVLKELIRSQGLSDVVKTAGEIEGGENVYIAFSPQGKKGKLYAKQFSDGIADFRADGRLDKILGKYGIDDWIER